MNQDRITIRGPEKDGTYIVEFKIADGDSGTPRDAGEATPGGGPCLGPSLRLAVRRLRGGVGGGRSRWTRRFQRPSAWATVLAVQ